MMINRNLLYPGIGALGVVAVVFGYTAYQDRQNAGGIEIKLGEGGVSIEGKQAIPTRTGGADADPRSETLAS